MTHYHPKVVYDIRLELYTNSMKKSWPRYAMAFGDTEDARFEVRFWNSQGGGMTTIWHISTYTVYIYNIMQLKKTVFHLRLKKGSMPFLFPRSAQSWTARISHARRFLKWLTGTIQTKRLGPQWKAFPLSPLSEAHVLFFAEIHYQKKVDDAFDFWSREVTIRKPIDRECLENYIVWWKMENDATVELIMLNPLWCYETGSWHIMNVSLSSINLHTSWKHLRKKRQAFLQICSSLIIFYMHTFYPPKIW